MQIFIELSAKNDLFELFNGQLQARKDIQYLRSKMEAVIFSGF